MTFKLRPAMERFWEAVEVEQNSGCWLWSGTVTRDGYGQFWNGKKRCRPHRFIYAEMVGRVADDEVVCHRCDTPLCVNPQHLFKGTVRDNNADRSAKGRTAVGERSGNARLTDGQVRQIRADARKYADIAADHGVSSFAVQCVKRGKTWKHLL